MGRGVPWWFIAPLFGTAGRLSCIGVTSCARRSTVFPASEEFVEAPGCLRDWGFPTVSDSVESRLSVLSSASVGERACCSSCCRSERPRSAWFLFLSVSVGCWDLKMRLSAVIVLRLAQCHQVARLEDGDTVELGIGGCKASGLTYLLLAFLLLAFLRGCLSPRLHALKVLVRIIGVSGHQQSL